MCAIFIVALLLCNLILIHGPLDQKDTRATALGVSDSALAIGIEAPFLGWGRG
jgi:hypothetical protein